MSETPGDAIKNLLNRNSFLDNCNIQNRKKIFILKSYFVIYLVNGEVRYLEHCTKE